MGAQRGIEGGAKFKTPALAPALAVEYQRFHREDDQKSLEAAVRKTSSSSPEIGTNMSDPQMREMATN
jgi:hypothetical protein